MLYWVFEMRKGVKLNKFTKIKKTNNQNGPKYIRSQRF